MFNPGSPINILHLEDDSDDADLLRLTLDREKFSYTMKVIGTKEELEQCFSSEYNLIITDYNLRNYNGLSAIQWIRSRDAIVPIIVVSGTVGEEMAVGLLNGGASDFILKANLKRLPRVVETVLLEWSIKKERIKFQETLLEKNLILDTMFNSFEDFVFLKDTEFKYVKVNQAFCDFLELREEEILGKVNKQFENLNHIDKDDENDEIVLKSGKKVVYENDRISFKGSRQTFEITKKPVISGGKVTGIFGHARNISVRKALLEESERSQFIFNQAERLTGSGSFEYDDDMDIIHCSNNFIAIFGLENSSFSLRKFTNIVREEDRPLFVSGINEAIAHRKEYYQEHRFSIAGKGFGHFKVLLRPDHRQGRKNLFYGTVVDVTDEHTNSLSLMEKLEQDRKDIARELHDNLGQQLTAISMFISRILEGQPDHKELNRTKEIAHQAIDDLSKLLINISVKQVEDHSLEYAVDKLLDYIPKEMKLIKNFNIGEDKLSSMVKAQLYRVIQEALNNITKHSKATIVKLQVSTIGSIVDLIIEDNGVGFELNKEKVGNGIKNMTHRVKTNNGLISIHSKKNSGTKISIKMPII